MAKFSSWPLTIAHINSTILAKPNNQFHLGICFPHLFSGKSLVMVCFLGVLPQCSPCLLVEFNYVLAKYSYNVPSWYVAVFAKFHEYVLQFSPYININIVTPKNSKNRIQSKNARNWLKMTFSRSSWWLQLQIDVLFFEKSTAPWLRRSWPWLTATPHRCPRPRNKWPPGGRSEIGIPFGVPSGNLT